MPIFVAVDAVGILPLFISLTTGTAPGEKKRVIRQSVVTALSLAVVFILVGKALFRLLGISVGDFMVAGGMILFCVAIIDLFKPGKKRRMVTDELGVVPLGTPLIVGPAVLTTCLVSVDNYGIVPTIISVVINVGIAGTLFWFSDAVIKVIGKAGATALSKVMALLLGAIAVMMIRRGLTLLITAI